MAKRWTPRPEGSNYRESTQPPAWFVVEQLQRNHGTDPTDDYLKAREALKGHGPHSHAQDSSMPP